MTKVLYPGSFDPITKGHMNIIEQACNLFDEVIIVVLQNPLKKNGLFTIEERAKIIKKLYKTNNNISIIVETKTAVDIAQKHKCQAIIRGLRNFSDFNFEIQLQQINKEISNNKINTICLFADKEYQFVSSSIVKEILNLNKDISKYVDPLVKKECLKKRGEINE